MVINRPNKKASHRLAVYACAALVVYLSNSSGFLFNCRVVKWVVAIYHDLHAPNE